ncbi:MAG: hypothetical protein K8U57_25350 [Planctomycetes bacterium]|nr:hypothetical protein [Planctomycetota bacterium]
MNLTVTNAPSVAELARGVLEGQTLVAGQSFYAAGSGVVVVLAPLPPEETTPGGADHELTISTGFPPDPAAAGITVRMQRRGETGGQLERLGETDRFGALLFTPGSAGTEYQLSVTRGSGIRFDPDAVAILQFTAPTVSEPEKAPEPVAVAAPCPVCRATSDGWTAKLGALREAWGCGMPVCRTHLTGQENVVLAAARDAWHHKVPEVFSACARLLADLLDEPGAVRKGFLQPYPVELRNQALNQAAALLSTAIAVGHVQSKNPGKAVAAGHAAAVHFQAAMGTERTRSDAFAGRLTTAANHPLGSLWSRIAPRVGGECSQGFLAFRHLSASITQQETEPPAFAPLRDRAVVVRPLLYDRDRAIGTLARIEFLPVAEGCGEVYLDIASLGFRILDPQLLRSLEVAWRSIQPTFTREHPGAAVCVRVTSCDDDSATPVLQGGSAGLAVACGLLALDRGDVLDENTAATGELLPGNASTELGTFGAGWTGRVTEKLEAVRSHALGRVVVGVLDEGIRYPGQLDRNAKANFEAIPTRTVNDAYRVLCRGPFVGNRPQSISLY